MLLYPDSEPFPKPLSASERLYHHHRPLPAEGPASGSLPTDAPEVRAQRIVTEATIRPTAWSPKLGTPRDRWVCGG